METRFTFCATFRSMAMQKPKQIKRARLSNSLNNKSDAENVYLVVR